MAINFKNIKSTVLDMTDTITVGKLQGCRVCDVIPEQFEYLIWADKQGLMKFTKIVVETIKEHAGYKGQQEQLEDDTFVRDLIRREREMIRTILDDDVPF